MEKPVYSVPFVLIIQNKCDKPRRVKLFNDKNAAFEPEGLMIYKLGMTENDDPFSVKNHEAYVELIRTIQEKDMHIIGKIYLGIIEGSDFMSNIDLFAIYIKYKSECSRKTKFIEYPLLIEPTQFRSDCINLFPQFDIDAESDIELSNNLEYISFIMPARQKMIFVAYPAASGQRDVPSTLEPMAVIITDGKSEDDKG